MSIFKKYGQCEHKLLRYIYYESDEADIGRTQAPLNDSLELLERFGILFKSENDYADERVRSYFQALFPLACSASYTDAVERNRTKTTPCQWDDCLYNQNDEFELYFIRLDQINRYRDECKELNALRKEKMLWASRVGPADNEYYNYFECDLSAGYSKVADEDLDLKQIEHDIYDENGNLKFEDEERLKADYLACRVLLEIYSPMRMPRCFFARFVVAMQPLLAERFDWSDALIGRDLNDTLVRARFNSNNRNEENRDLVQNPRVRVEIKAKGVDSMVEMKNGILEVFNSIKVYYPGLYFFTKIEENYTKN